MVEVRVARLQRNGGAEILHGVRVAPQAVVQDAAIVQRKAAARACTKRRAVVLQRPRVLPRLPCQNSLSLTADKVGNLDLALNSMAWQKFERLSPSLPRVYQLLFWHIADHLKTRA